MTTSRPLLRQSLAVGACLLAIAVAPVLAAVTAPSAAHPLACGAGEEQDVYSEACVPHTVPNSPSVGTVPGNPDVAEVDGIPCTGRDSGECIGLQEDEPDFVPPTSSVGSSPTVYGVE